jgi:hypothetical protein
MSFHFVKSTLEPDEPFFCLVLLGPGLLFGCFFGRFPGVDEPGQFPVECQDVGQQPFLHEPHNVAGRD